MVRAWIADVTPLYDKACYEKYYHVLPEFRKKKADALRAVSMKAQSVGVWSLWEKIRSQYSLAESTVFNFSHSGTYVMCAAALDGKHVQVGCDLEKIGELKERLAGRFFCREEYETIMEGETDEEKAELFYRYWVLKESFMKATGKGMALPLQTFCIRMGEPPALIRQPEEFPEQYYYREYKVEGLPYCVAVCSTDKDIDAKLNTELKL